MINSLRQCNPPEGLHVFDGLKNAEVNDCRLKLRQVSEQERHDRNSWDLNQRLAYIFPKKVSAKVPEYVEKMMNSNDLSLEIRFQASKVTDDQLFQQLDALSNFQKFHHLILDRESTPQQLIEMVMPLMIDSSPLDTCYILCVTGRNEYIWGEEPLIMFQVCNSILVF